VLPQGQEIIFEVQRKRNNEKLNKKKNKLSKLQNVFFFISFSLDYNSNRATYKEFFECLKISLVMFDGLFF